jgi:hypothetical protein
MVKNFKIDGSLQTTGNLVVQGNLDVKGTTTTVNQETLTVNDNLIVTNAQGALTPYTGVVAVTGNDAYINAYVGSGESSFKNFNYNNLTWNETVKIYVPFRYNGRNYHYIKFDISYQSIVFCYENLTAADFVYTTIWQNGGFLNNSNDYNVFWEANDSLTFSQSEVAFLSELFNNPPVQSVLAGKEAYAAPVYNTDDNEIQLGKGYITTDENNKVEFNFIAGENQALATRSGDFGYNAIPYWDTESNSFKPSGLMGGDDGTILFGNPSTRIVGDNTTLTIAADGPECAKFTNGTIYIGGKEVATQEWVKTNTSSTIDQEFFNSLYK